MNAPSPRELAELDLQLQALLDLLLREEAAKADWIQAVQPQHQASARNLVHYLAFRSQDQRALQGTLSNLGLSSFAHAEGYTLANLQQVLRLLQLLQGRPLPPESPSPFRFFASKKQLQANTAALFGPPVAGEPAARIMVTIPSEAAQDYALVRNLLAAGMNIARINTSHDSVEAWTQMIGHIERARAELGKTCLIYVDLSGPKMRTITRHYPTEERDRDFRMVKKDGYLVFVNDVVRLLRSVDQLESGVPHDQVVMTLGTTLPAMFADLQVGQPIFFDDGKIGGRIQALDAAGALVQITQSAITGSVLRGEKGINLPDTALSLPALTAADRAALPFAARFADILGYSFVRRPSDVAELQAALQDLGREELGIVLKIETKEAFENLPLLLLTALRSKKIGLMVARGDLAVEVGWERHAELQEEILWLAEAAHVPGILATQVLESLAKNGLASRGDITDAAMAVRAECVMLNKGPYIIEAVKSLRNILMRMEQHHDKKWGSLRPLSVAKNFCWSKAL